MMKKATLIATVYNEIDNIHNWVDSVYQQTLFPHEIVIVDGGSTDGTYEYLCSRFKGKDVHVIRDESCSLKMTEGPIAKGRNIAISRATNEFIIATDAGCILDRYWYQRMFEKYENGSDYVAGAYDINVTNRFQKYIRRTFVPDFGRVNFPGNFLPSSRSIGFSKHLWEVVHGYPEVSFAGEDTYFSCKLAEVASNMSVAEDALVYWNAPSDFLELMKKVYIYGYGDGILAQDISRYLFRAAMIFVPPIVLVLVVIRKKQLIAYPLYVIQVSGFVVGMLRRFMK